MLFASLVIIWQSFFTLNQITSYSNGLNTKQLIVSDSRINYRSSDLSMLRVSLLVILSTTVHASTLRFNAGYIFFDQLFINESLRRLFILVLVIYSTVCWLNLVYFNSKVNLPSDYTCSNCTFFLIAPYIMLSSNFYSFFFIIELLGLAILVKFTFLPLTYSSKGESKRAISSTPKPLVISIFTYYWMSFFSSSFIIIYIIFMLFAWGTVDYYELLNVTNLSSSSVNRINSFFYSSLGLLFSLGFLLKAGAAPFHMYKVSLYEGLPLFSIFNYTLMFYVTYLFYFSYLIPVLVQSSGLLSTLVATLVTLLGLLTLSVSLFSNRHLKTFLALSSSLNAALLFMLLLSIV